MAAVTAMVSWFDARIYTNMKKMRCGRSNDSNTECITQVLPGPWSTSPLPCALSTFASVVEYRKGKINYAKYLSSPATCEHTHTYIHTVHACNLRLQSHAIYSTYVLTWIKMAVMSEPNMIPLIGVCNSFSYSLIRACSVHTFTYIHTYIAL